MLREVLRKEWSNVVEKENYSIFLNPDFLHPVSQIMGCALRYYIFYWKDKPIIGFACFIKRKKIIVPTHFIYSGIWHNTSLSTIRFRNVLLDALKELKKSYISIEFRLPPSFNDIRPFQWEGFSYVVNYTYLKPLSDLNFEYNIRARARKTAELGIVLSLSSSFNKVWQHQKTDLKRFNFPDFTLSKLERLFKIWYETGFLRLYEAEDSEITIGSSCVFVDEVSSTAFNLLISSGNTNYHTGVHAALYSFICKKLSETITNFDLYGADIKGVADFKSSLGASLIPHFTVKYSRRKYLFLQSLKKAKLLLIRLRGKLF